MKNIMLNKAKEILALFLVLLLCITIAPVSFAEEAVQDPFETEIAAFPESYKPYLRNLHTAHPNWKFEPFFTTLDFNEAVDNECGPKSLVSSSVSSNVFKSKDIGDYNYEKNYFIQKDGGFVEANRLAVAYYMDPRNFLNDDGIFLFETLIFNDSFTVAAVENVLRGSFMADKKITYYNAKGKLKTINQKYSEAIFNAGKTYNVNPCFIASKILNEVGYSGSNSVTGLVKEYPGIYNFYNIGATDGAGAIGRGLAWASSGTTYSRPWNTPVKSINGGAEYLAEKYIACGQFTGYLQRFNVNPNNTSHPVYTHQYMTNLTGALSQGYSTYDSYVKSGLIDNTYVFSIPVYENMPSQTTVVGDGELIDSAGQSAEVSVSACYVRTGPSPVYDKLLDVSGTEIKLTKGTPLTVLDKVTSDSTYYLNFLQYPHWYKVNFVYGGTTYEGYIFEGNIDVTTLIKVGKGEYAPGFLTSDGEVDMHVISFDPNIALITENNTVNFIKNGTVNIGAYDSLGKFDKVKYVVTDEPSVIPTSVSLSDIKPTTAVLNFTLSAGASEYEVIAVDTKGNIAHRQITTSSPYIVTGLTSGTNYNIFVRAVLDSTGSKTYGPAVSVPLITLPDDTVVNKVTKDEKGNVTVHWNGLAGIEGYKVAVYNPATTEYTEISSLPADAVSYTVPAEQLNSRYFAFCAYGSIGTETVYGDYSKIIDITNIPGDVTETNVTNVTKGGYTVTWSTVEGARYNLYKENNGEYVQFKSFANPKYKLKKAGYSAFSKYKVAAYKEVDGIVYESVPTAEFSATSLPAKVAKLKISATAYGGNLKWNKVSNATGYQIYIYKENKGKYVRLATVRNNKYTLKGRKPGKALKVRVRTIINTTYGKYYGDYADLSFKTRPERIDHLDTNNITTSALSFTWDKCEGASKYILYQYNGKKRKFVKVKDTTSRSHSATGLKAGTTYKYRVKSVKTLNGKVFSSNISVPISLSTLPETVKNVSLLERKKKALTLSWKKVAGAEEYEIYRYNSSKKKYYKIDTVYKGTKCYVDGLKSGKTYYFKIKAVKYLDGQAYKSELSQSFGFSTK